MSKKIVIACFPVIILLLSSLPAAALVGDSLIWKGEIKADVGGGAHNPFWLVANRYGGSSIEKNNGYLRLSMVKPMNSTRRWDWGAGIDLSGGFRREAPFLINQAYGEIRYRCLDLMIGQKEMEGQIVDPNLSTGNLLLSSNAIPVPQIRAGIFDYADIWGCRGWLGIKGYIAFGKFTDSRWLRNWVEDGVYPQGVLYHSKGLWLRNGNPDKFPLQFEAGIEMATQFGGSAWSRRYPDIIEHIKLPSGLKAFWKALVPLGGDETTIAGEQANVQGNFIGNWTFRLSWLPKNKDWNMSLYYQHLFEDHSMLYIEYPWRDGLYGLEAKFPKNPFVSKALYEFVYFKDQTGPVYWDHTQQLPEQISGRDNYYNHYIYGAWQNWGMLMGSPLAVSPIYNDHTLTLKSTRFIAHHFGFEGNPLPNLNYRCLLTWSRHWGTYSHPLPDPENSFNFLAEVKYAPVKLRGWQGGLAVAADGGSLFGRSVALQITISKTGFIRF